MTAPATRSPIPPIADAPSMPTPPGTPTATESASRPNPPHPTTGTSPATPTRRGSAVTSWPLLLLALPAAIATWSGWVGIGQMTGFGIVHPLPGISPGLRLDTAITLPVGVEAYAAYALRAWLSPNHATTPRTRRFARRSALGSLTLGMAGQVAYHLLAQAHTTHAPWPITTAVACLPVLVLGMGAALAHLLHADTHPDSTAPTPATAPDQTSTPWATDQLAHATATATGLIADGHRISRRTLRAAGITGSNANLGTLAATLRATSSATGNHQPPQQPQTPEPA
jgi:hypothetical protein